MDAIQIRLLTSMDLLLMQFALARPLSLLNQIQVAEGASLLQLELNDGVHPDIKL